MYEKILDYFFAAIVAGCSGIPYAPKGTTIYAGGYSDEKLGSGKYLVRFEGNGFNQMPQVVEYVRLRASELCASHEFDIEVKEYISTHTEIGYANGIVYPSTHRFPNAEGVVTCKQ